MAGANAHVSADVANGFSVYTLYLRFRTAPDGVAEAFTACNHIEFGVVQLPTETEGAHGLFVREVQPCRCSNLLNGCFEKGFLVCGISRESMGKLIGLGVGLQVANQV